MALGGSSRASAAEPVATFSIVGYDPETGDLGVAVQSKFFAVGSVVPYAQAGVGAIASQAYGNTTFGPLGLAMLVEGLDVRSIVDSLLAHDPNAAQRQIGIVDALGNSFAYTGDECMEWAGSVSGANFTAQGNILVSEATVQAMAKAFLETEAMLGERLMRAIEAGQAAGGDSRGMQSAAILVVRESGGYGGYNDRYCDLRVDDSEDPIAELRRIFDMWKGQALILEGYRYAEAGDWERAFAYGREAVAMNPDEGEPHYHLACYYSKADKREEALAELQVAVRLDESLAARARLDSDFKPLYEDPEFIRITGE
ncbi:MAG: DUF1028 domain-containing protein [Candidatus Eisenbacteria bacterium]|nr:DUF1028 domain-containing protein [Candidatus Eisenbacteria bacterium]